MDKFEAHGKFLISGEYFILHGAKGLALPLTKMKQTLEVYKIADVFFTWTAHDINGSLWFHVDFNENLEIQSSSDQKLALKLQLILTEIKSKEPEIFRNGHIFKTYMNFSTDWGLGSSSTLISLLSQWSGVNDFYLQKIFFGGSGYDIACATANSPLIYQLKDGDPKFEKVHWNPRFKENLYFIYLGKKKDSRTAMEEFKMKNSEITLEQIESIDALTTSFVEASTLGEFQDAIRFHEKFISDSIGIPPIKDQVFSDFEGEIKSLGGWGGDFIMAATSMNRNLVKDYFSRKGMKLIFQWDEISNTFSYG